MVTKDDFDRFKYELLAELNKILTEKKTNETREYLKTWEVMKAFNISKGTLQLMRSKGELPFTRIGKCIYFKYDDIKKILDQNQTGKK